MASVSRHVKLVCRSSTAMPGVNTNIGRSTKLLVSYEQPSYTRRGAVQRPTSQGGMPKKRLICCVSLPDATLLSVLIYEFAIANEELAIEEYFPCCGITICRGCVYSNIDNVREQK